MLTKEKKQHTHTKAEKEALTEPDSSIPDMLSKQEMEKLLNKNNTKDEEFGENIGDKLRDLIDIEV